MVPVKVTIEHKCRGVRFAFTGLIDPAFDANLRCISEIGEPIAFTFWLYRLSS